MSIESAVLGRPWARAALLLVSGILASLGQAPLSWFIAMLAGFALAARAFVSVPDTTSATWSGLFFGIGYFGAALFWVVEPFLVDPASTAWMAPFALVFVALGLAAFWGVAFGIAHAAGSGPPTRILALALLLAAVGIVREHLLTGFPWALPAYGWSETPVIQSLAYFGPHPLTFLTVLAAGSLALKARRVVGMAISVCVVLSLWIAGEFRLSDPSPDNQDTAVVRIVQPNVDQSRKWNRFYVNQNFTNLLLLIMEPTDMGFDFVLLPETVLTFLLDENDDRLAFVSDAALGKQVLTGIRSYEDDEIYNSLAAIGPGGTIEGVYDKQHLVPFGEYLPFGDFLMRIGLLGLAVDEFGQFSPGEGTRTVEVSKVGRMLALICYEAIFPGSVRGAERSEGILNVTNDAWFGKLSGPQQHLVHVRMRAVELGLPVLRAANTGISAVIDGKGQVNAYLPLGTSGILDVPVPKALPATPYSKVGDVPFMMLFGTLMSFLIARRIRIRH